VVLVLLVQFVIVDPGRGLGTDFSLPLSELALLRVCWNAFFGVDLCAKASGLAQRSEAWETIAATLCQAMPANI